MKIRSNSLMALAALAALGLVGLKAPDARAGLLPGPPPVSVVAEGSYFRWTYTIFLPGGQYIDPGDYFTIHDFAGFVAGSEAYNPVDGNHVWEFSSPATGPFPPTVSFFDDAAIPNLSWKYAGETAISGGIGGLTVGTFSALSEFESKGEGQFTSAIHRDFDEGAENSQTITQVPVDDTVVDMPEPASLVMMGLGLPLVGAYGAYRRRKLVVA